MKLHLLAVGTRPPDWAAAGFNDFARRMRAPFSLDLTEIPLAKRRRGEPPDRAIAAEAGRLRDAVPAGAVTVALDPKGGAWTTEELARRLGSWRDESRDVAFLVGGPDGLDDATRSAADAVWSLGPLTLPHMLVRVIVAEQLYRAWSILRNHPYHRG